MKALTILAAALLTLAAAPEARADDKIMIVTWRGCEEACRGFQDYIAEKDASAEIVVRDAARDQRALPGILAEARAEKVDLILSWGTTVTSGIAGTLADMGDPAFNHEIPQVFMIVSDPVGAGVVESLDRTGRPMVTGTYNRVPEAVNIQTIRSYDPAFARLGLLYNRNEDNSVLKRDEMAALAEAMGFDFTAVELALGADGTPRVEDIPGKLAELKAAGADWVYLGSSSFLRNHEDAFTSAAVEVGLPVLSPYEHLVRESQALMSVSARYYEIGRLAGAQAEKILVDGIAPGDLPVARMQNFAIVINLDVARRLKLLPPIDLLQVAETVTTTG